MHICGIIKPHALDRSREIIDALAAGSILILETKPLVYTDELVEILYDHMSAAARSGIARQLVEQEGLALLLEAPSIVQLLEIVGTESNPSACAPGTIRYHFGIHADPILTGDDPWWENAFHRPIDAREAARDLSYIFNR